MNGRGQRITQPTVTECKSHQSDSVTLVNLPLALVAGAFGFVCLAGAALLLGRHLDVGQRAQAAGLVVLAAFHAAMDALVLLLSHV